MDKAEMNNMATINKTLLTDQNSILPKSRSEWIYRSDNTSYESNINHIEDIIRSGVLYNGIHSKSGTIHTISNIPTDIPSMFSIKFKATSNYLTGDTFSINGVSYVVKDYENIGFTTESIIECNIDNINTIVYLLNKKPLIPPYKPTDLPQFTYSGGYTTVDDGANGWRIRFTSSGTFILVYPDSITIDGFIVGGGGGGGNGYWSSTYWGHSGAGGGGGYTNKFKNSIVTVGTSYVINVGSGGSSGINGGKSDGFGRGANGGYGGSHGNSNDSGNGGNGGSGGGQFGRYSASSHSYSGKGGSNGSNGNGADGSTRGGKVGKGGTGQGSTTREFGESSGTLYSGGGGGAGKYGADSSSYGASGGDGGGGYGGDGADSLQSGTSGSNGGRGSTNTGGGGGGAGCHNRWTSANFGGKGGSGIVIIRNAR